MKKRKLRKTKEIQKLKKNIKRIAPEVEGLDVKVDLAENGDYKTLIKVAMPPKKNLIAVKRHESFGLALEKSKQAILKQVKKIKAKRKPKKYIRNSLLRHIA